jgi:hypothetical protein
VTIEACATPLRTKIIVTTAQIVISFFIFVLLFFRVSTVRYGAINEANDSTAANVVVVAFLSPPFWLMMKSTAVFREVVAGTAWKDFGAKGNSLPQAGRW